MRRRSPQEQEDGFHLLLPHVGEHLDELIEAFTHEPDRGLRCWLLDLIGEARSPAALPFLAARLHDPDPDLRDRAVASLARLDTRDARTVLWNARSSGLIDERPPGTGAGRRS